MGWSFYLVSFEARFIVDCHGGRREVEEEALYTEVRARLATAVHAAALAVIEDPKYAALHPEWDGSTPERNDE